ncbi:Dyp-type peroxidase [Lujinxingia litoralis]|uniref:Dyp-type peroxidase n=1 Tax=Lujinxingia litoralis TaxID=2211119 RepID=UPI0011B94B82|nr:hypothetical protein [Lujinxingia litoralis]
MPTSPDPSHCQSLAFTGFGSLPHTLMLRIEGITPAWLGALIPHLAFGRERREQAVQLLLSAPGLHALGADPDAVATLGRELREGMTSLPSAQRLGDIGPHAPSPRWWSDRDHHGVLLLYAASPQALHHLADTLPAGVHILTRQALSLPATSREPFGFFDGITPTARQQRTLAPTPPGELFLGRPDQTGDTPRVAPLAQDGTLVVLRELEQDVRAFWRFFMRAANDEPRRATELAARAVGRWPNGMPLKPGQTTEPPFERDALFWTSFADDPRGQACPFGAHVRRANPRDTLVTSPELSLQIAHLHRLIRRGRAFGPPAPRHWYPPALRDHMPEPDPAAPPEAPRGLMFMGLCTDIRRQFEFIHQNWLMAPKHADLFDEIDPLLAHATSPRTLTLPTDTFAHRLHGVGDWVHPRGGGYYLMPTRPALDILRGPEA